MNRLLRLLDRLVNLGLDSATPHLSYVKHSVSLLGECLVVLLGLVLAFISLIVVLHVQHGGVVVHIQAIAVA